MASVTHNTLDTDMMFSGVFKSLEAVKKCLCSEKYKKLPEVEKLLKIFNDNYSVNQDEVLERSQHKVFIVLEGIDASGKTTISKRLAKLISGVQLSTPPPALMSLREKFDGHEIELRRAYYSLGNYLAAQQVMKTYKPSPVIMDRFWHSTAAYAIAHQAIENHNGTIPPEGDAIYEWPIDLLKPDIVFFLSVSESKRLDRLMRRKNKPITREELKLKDDKAFRDTTIKVFERLCNPGVVFVNADLYPKKVANVCMERLADERLLQIPNSDPYQESFEDKFDRKTKLN